MLTVGRCSALGTDGEKALMDAFKHEFRFAQHMTCFNHVRRNVKDMLCDCNVPTSLRDDILDAVFGKKVGSVYTEGLVDATDTADFEEKLDKLVDSWRDAPLPSTANIERFITWFLAHKAPVVRNSMLRSVREECGLGSPPGPFTTNACETANSMLKNEVKRSEMFKFLNKLTSLIQEQEREVERALIGRGKYELRPQYALLCA